MPHIIKRLRRAIWTVRQPLTRIPMHLGMPVSDLFVWRYSPIWETYFDLTDIPGLFLDHETEGGRHAILYFFDRLGRLVSEQYIELLPYRRHTLELSKFVANAGCDIGTFSVFHPHAPASVLDLGSYIAERGYISYCYQGAPLRSYVHGNLDAVALAPDGNLQMLGSTSLLKRQFRLQYAMHDESLYEFGIVNSTSRVQRVRFQMHSMGDDKVLDVQEAELKPRGIHVFEVFSQDMVPPLVTIDSHIVMARPLVFKTSNDQLDVFHG
jgi:hypothetical protein